MHEYQIARNNLVMLVACLALSAPSLAAAPQSSSSAASAPVQQKSLGEVARRVAAEQAKSPEKSARVYTNADLKSISGGISVVGGPAATSEASGAQAAEAGLNAQHFRERAAKLRSALSTHQRELEVLRQKLGLNQSQYYSNPTETLHQEYSRSNINKITREIDAKKQQIQADQQSLDDLQQEVRRTGGDSSWLQGGTAEGGAAAPPGKAEPHTAAEWKDALDAARARLAKAQEEQKLSEDEQSLLESQEARAVTTGNTTELAAKIAGKKTEVEAKRAATEKAQEELQDLEQRFAESNASGGDSQ